MFESLARIAAKNKHFRWLGGMNVSFERNGALFGPYRLDGDGDTFSLGGDWEVSHESLNDGGIPDLTDPATISCLLHLVRKAYRDDCVFVYRTYPPHMGGSWRVFSYNPGTRLPSHRYFNTEAEALVAALEAAP